MGYRSDVSAVFYANKGDWPVMKLFFDENFPMEAMGASVREFETNHLQGYYFYEDSVKWYDGYAEVQAFNAFVHKFVTYIEDEAHRQPWMYEFARIGEDYDDVETKTEGDIAWLLNIERVVTRHFTIKETEDEDAKA